MSLDHNHFLQNAVKSFQCHLNHGWSKRTVLVAGGVVTGSGKLVVGEGGAHVAHALRQTATDGQVKGLATISRVELTGFAADNDGLRVG